jgi:hypothetical protein
MLCCPVGLFEMQEMIRPVTSVWLVYGFYISAWEMACPEVFGALSLHVTAVQCVPVRCKYTGWSGFCDSVFVVAADGYECNLYRFAVCLQVGVWALGQGPCD